MWAGGGERFSLVVRVRKALGGAGRSEGVERAGG